MEPPRLALVGTASACGHRGGENDDRVVWDEAKLLGCLADASGPGYGGYHAPFGVEPALERLRAAFESAPGDAGSRLHEAMSEADHVCRVLERRLRDALGRGRGVRAAQLAADAVRPARWEALRGRSLGHCFTSLTALSCELGRVFIEQCGSSRAYLLRAGRLTLLAPDQTLSSMLRAEGRHDEAEAHPGVTTALLGAGDRLQSVGATSTIERGDRLALVSDGVWGGDAGESRVLALLRADGPSPMTSIVQAAAEASRDDASALSLAVR